MGRRFCIECPTVGGEYDPGADRPRVSLNGVWQVRLDRDKRGVEEKWFADGVEFESTVNVPGTIQGQGIGDDKAEVVKEGKFEAKVTHAVYQGTIWLRREFGSPGGEAWSDRRVWLVVGGVHPRGEFWVNGENVATHRPVLLPFRVDVTDVLRGDGPNVLAVRISEADRELAGGYNWLTSWSGLYRGVLLEGVRSRHLVDVFPQADGGGTVQVRVTAAGPPQKLESLKIVVREAAGGNVVAQQEAPVPGEDDETAGELQVVHARRWELDDPFLYECEVRLKVADRVVDVLRRRFGFRDFHIEGRRAVLSGRQLWLRSAGDFYVHPLTLSPCIDRSELRRQIRALKAWGFDHVRMNSNVPVAEWMDVADEEGLWIQAEPCALGGWQVNSDEVSQETLEQQTYGMVKHTRHHPAALAYCMSNERFVYWGEDPQRIACVQRLYDNVKRLAPHCVFMYTDGGSDDRVASDMYAEWGGHWAALKSKPVMLHEHQWWTSVPDPKGKGQYTGAMRPYYHELFEGKAQEAGLGEHIDVWVDHSQRLAALQRKEKVEYAIRTYPQLAGLSMWTGADSAWAVEGILDDFYQPKRHPRLEDWRESWSDTVLVWDRPYEKRNLVGSGVLPVTVYCADFGRDAWGNAALQWELSIAGQVQQRGEIAPVKPVHGRTAELVRFDVLVPAVERGQCFELRVTLAAGDRQVSNHWKLWVFGPKVAVDAPLRIECVDASMAQRIADGLDGAPATGTARDLLVCDRVTPGLLDHLRSGGKAVLRGSRILPDVPPEGFTPEYSSFWTPAANYPSTATSATLIAGHPIMDGFTHERWCDLQFFRMMHQHPPLDLSAWPCTIEPLVRAFGSYRGSGDKGFLVDVGVGEGHLVISAFGIHEADPGATDLMGRCLAYLADSELPTAGISAEQLQALAAQGPRPLATVGPRGAPPH